MESSLWYCDNLDLYSILCPTKIDAFTRKHYKRFRKGEYIYFMGDVARNVYMISEGKVKIVQLTEGGDEIVKAILSRGEIFGELAILGEERRADIAISMSTKTQLCPIPKENMYDLMRTDQQFSTRIYKLIGWRIRKLERRLESIVFKDARTRLIDFIYDLLPNTDINQPIVVRHNYTQKDIADLIGVRRETVSLILSELREDGLLTYNRGEFVLNSCPKSFVRQPATA